LNFVGITKKEVVILSILSNIEGMLKEQGKTQKELCAYLGLSPTSFSMWKSGDSESYMKFIPKIAQFFGTPVSLIYGERGTPKQFALNKKIESLPPDVLDAVDAFIEVYTKKRNS